MAANDVRNDVRIVFNTFGSVDLPDGSCLGVQGEHNVVRLAITLPESMVVGMTYHTITLNGVESAWITTTANNDGAYRDGNILYVPLTCDMTQYMTVDLFVTAYRQEGAAVSLVDRTITVRGLQFAYSNSEPPKVKPGGLVAEVYQIEQRVDVLEDQLGEAVRTEEIFHALASHNMYEVDTWDEVSEFPCTTVKQGERIHLRKPCQLYDNVSSGIVPVLNSPYRACYFLKDISDVFNNPFLKEPESPHNAWYELLTLARSNGETYSIWFYYHDLFGSYVLQVVPHTDEAFENRTENYYFVPRTCTFTVEPWGSYIGGRYTMYAGWNREYTVDVDDYRQSLAYEKITVPPPLFDVVCTQLTIDPPESLPEDLSSLLTTLMPFLISLDSPPSIWVPSGVYECFSEDQGVRLQSGFRKIAFVVRASEDAWSNGKQTIPILTASVNDIYSPYYPVCMVHADGSLASDPSGKKTMWKYQPLSTYGIKVVKIGDGLITLAKTSEYSLTEDTEFTGSLRRIYVHDTSEYYDFDDHAHDYTIGGTVFAQPTCTATGSQRYTCSCGAEKAVDIPALGHNWGEWVVTTEPTQEVDGVETRTCSRCGETETRGVLYTVEDEPSDPIPLDPTPIDDPSSEEPPAIAPEYLDDEGNDGSSNNDNEDEDDLLIGDNYADPFG